MLSRIFSPLVFLICFCGGILFIFCESTTKSEPEPFLDILWILESFDIDGNIVKPPKDQLYTIRFKDNNTVSGKSDCNDFFADYQIKPDDSLRVEQFVTTYRGCGGDQVISDIFVLGVREAKFYKIHKKKLYIYYGDTSKLIFYSE